MPLDVTAPGLDALAAGHSSAIGTQGPMKNGGLPHHAVRNCRFAGMLGVNDRLPIFRLLFSHLPIDHHRTKKAIES